MTSDTTTAQGTIHNPVLPGFHPDPSILRVGADYYIATSTFEWFPAVRLHHSTDLVTWRPMHGALAEKRLLDLTGAADSCGVWAPNLTYADGVFYLVYTDVATFLSGYWDPQNYVVMATDPAGPWSDPVVLHGRGFDASFFHDDDGTTWMLSMIADWRPGRDRFAGISIQQYDRDARCLVGDEHMIFKGTAAATTEGPNLYRIDGWYYLVTAEGGTSWEHQVTVARSRELFGPYEPDPAGPMITSFGRPDLTLQKAGHGSLVATPDGEWFLAHLVARPYTPLGRCVLGRETAIQRVAWSADGWPRVEGGIPADDVPGPGAVSGPLRDSSSLRDSTSLLDSAPRRDSAPLVETAAPLGAAVPEEETDEFDSSVLGPNWSTLRRPATPDWVSLSARPGFLRIAGGQSAAGRQRPSLVARRVTAFRCELETVVEFQPRNYRQLAGLTAYYNSRNWYYLHITADDDGRPVLDLLACDSGRVSVVPGVRRPLTGGLGVGLRARFDGPSLTFAWAGRPGSGPWQEAGPALDATILSDEYAAHIADGEPEAWGFTGAFLGLWVQDLGVEGGFADFDRAAYRTW